MEKFRLLFYFHLTYWSKGQGEHGLQLVALPAPHRHGGTLAQQLGPGQAPELDVAYADGHKLVGGVGTEAGLEDTVDTARGLGHFGSCDTQRGEHL